MSCKHPNFDAFVAVNRIEDKGYFAADVKIRCTECGCAMRFLGLPGGVSLRQPTVSAFGIEARLPIEPSDIITASDETPEKKI